MEVAMSLNLYNDNVYTEKELEERQAKEESKKTCLVGFLFLLGCALFGFYKGYNRK